MTDDKQAYTDNVVRCGECPFSYPSWSQAKWFCAHDGTVDHPSINVNDDAVLATVLDELPNPPPDWCPLRRGPTLVVLDL